ncbi:MAG TPA: C40 family peptidase [Acidimicrobiales bacterium]|nr:C40 family peptidase [Acidimicrobiales bacterium]
MIRVRRRGTTRSTPLVVLAFSVAALIITPTTARAGSISTTQTQIAALTNRLSRLEKTSEITSNQYDADKVKLATITANIKSLQSKEKTKRAAIKVTAKELVHAVVQAFVLGASDAQIEALFNQSATQEGARTVYENQVIGNLNQLKHTYMKEKTSLDSTIRAVGIQRVDAGKQTYAMSQLLALNIYNTNTTQSTLHKMTQALKGEIVSYEIQQGVIAAENHNLAGEEDAITAASAVGGQDAANQVTEAIQQASQTVTLAQVGSSAQGLAAVAAAERQIGVPYVWGGETPGAGFDCSGLVQWAWAQAGIQIPRTTESQWPDLVHVALNDLQPGDLLFYYNLDGDNAVDHVVMYVGSGPWGSSTVIAAAHTGTNVSFAPVFTNGLIGAARP